MAVERESLTGFGEFVLRFLNVAIDVNEIKWDDVLKAYHKYRRDHIMNENEKRIDLFRPGLVYINWVVSKYYDVDPSIMRGGESRKRISTKPRQVAHYIAVAIFKFTYQSVADFYNKDHTTILHSVKTVRNEIDTNKNYRSEIVSIIKKLNYGNNNQGTSTKGSIGEIQKAS